MPYTALITKGEVRKSSGAIYSVSVNYTINDGTVDVLTGTVNTKYNSNAPDLSVTKAELQNQIKEAWDKYVAEQGVKTAAAFDTIISQIQTAANGYINLGG